jgi:hypothetical protein
MHHYQFTTETKRKRKRKKEGNQLSNRCPTINKSILCPASDKLTSQVPNHISTTDVQVRRRYNQLTGSNGMRGG